MLRSPQTQFLTDVVILGLDRLRSNEKDTDVEDASCGHEAKPKLGEMASFFWTRGQSHMRVRTRPPRIYEQRDSTDT